MVTRHTADIVRHLEKQHELLVDAYSSKSDELHKLQGKSFQQSKNIQSAWPPSLDVPVLALCFQNAILGNTIEEEMLMRKFFDLMSAQGLMKTNDGNYTKVPDHGKNGKVGASVTICRNEKL